MPCHEGNNHSTFYRIMLDNNATYVIQQQLGADPATSRTVAEKHRRVDRESVHLFFSMQQFDDYEQTGLRAGVLGALTAPADGARQIPLMLGINVRHNPVNGGRCS